MKSIENETTDRSSCGKTCPESLALRTMLSAASLLALPAQACRLAPQADDGQTLVLLLDPKGLSPGASWMLNFSEWPNDAAACLLSQVLEQGSIPQKYFLSSTACAGILRRAEKRGKKLPGLLEMALRSVATGTE